MRVAILSPHRDDAAFSCGLTMHALLLAGADITVVNLFTRSDYAVDLRTIDPALSMVDGVSAARRLEDEHFVGGAAHAAGSPDGSVHLLDLDLLDAPLRHTLRTEQVLESPLTREQVSHEAAAIAQQLVPLQTFDLVFAPLALGDHIDHRVARESAKRCVSCDRLCLYEDLPYAARLTSEQRRFQALSAIESNGCAEFVQHATRVPNGAHLKRQFALYYPSQIAAEVADEMAHYAAQRDERGAGTECWWATPATGVLIAGLLSSAPASCTLVEEQQ